VRRLALACAALVLLACGGRDTPDDQGLHQDIQGGSSGAEVTFDASLLNDPAASGDHEVFEVTARTGETLQIDHNTSLAPWVPAHRGEPVIIHGQLYIDPGPRYGVHCTHAHTSSGCPDPGWIEYNNNYYE
jgi:hypothetical protein